MTRSAALSAFALIAGLASAHAAPIRKGSGAHAAHAPRQKGRSTLAAHGKKVAAPRRAPARTSTLPRVAADPDSPHERRITELRERLEALLHERPLSRTRVGVVAMQVSDGDVLFSHNGDQRFNPASNTKILTTAAALSRLGAGYRYPTALYGAPPDVDGVVGDIVLRGSDDPSLSATDLAELARRLAERGVTRVHGDVLVDRRPIGLDAEAESGLYFNHNAVAVRIAPTEPKHAPAVRVEPAGADIGVDNRAVTVPGRRTRLKIDAYRKDDRLVIEVRGRIGERRGTVVLEHHIGDGALLCGHVLAGTLRDLGIAFDGRVRLGADPAPEPSPDPEAGAHGDGRVLALHWSAPLSEIAALSNKPSNNFIADSIYKTLGGELYGLPGTLEKGTRAVGDWLAEHDIDRARFHLVNGSGLTHENRVTPVDLAQLLRAVYFEPQLAPEFLPSLAVGGVDGTIRNRFVGTDAVGLVRAKTGTLSGVSALSGYVGDKGDVMVFSILVEGFRHRTTPAVRQAQVRLVLAMLRYLHAEAGAEEPYVAPHESPPEQVMPDEGEGEGEGEGESQGQPESTTH